MSKRISDKFLEVDFRKMLRRYKKASAMTAKVRRSRRHDYDSGLPLYAWMSVDVGAGESRIEQVIERKVRHNFTTLHWVVNDMAMRIARRRQITEAQFYLLRKHIADRYPRCSTHARSTEDGFAPDWVIPTRHPDVGRWHTVNWLFDMCKGIDVPLSLILSDELTNLVLMHELWQAAHVAQVGARVYRANLSFEEWEKWNKSKLQPSAMLAA